MSIGRNYSLYWLSMSILLRIITKFIKVITLALLVFVFAVVVLLAYLVVARNTPLQLPIPTGSSPVGRVELDWIDSARTDPLADQGGSPRELVIWIWYPAANSGATTAPYLPAAWVQAREKDQGIGILIEKNFNQIQTHSYEDAPLAATPQVLPVLVMEPGMGPITTDYTIFAENLASRGYIVVGINPTYTANWTVFPDGRVALRSERGTIPESDTFAQAITDGNPILAVWAQDVIFVMDQLTRLNSEQTSAFNHRMDLDHIGVWGHSFGGATAMAVCQQDPRCKAGVDMDGTPMTDEMQATIPGPFMFITEDYRKGCDPNCELMRQVYQHTQPERGYFLSITGTRHFNFSDSPYRQTPILRPLFVLAGFEGSIQPARALQITNAYLVAFFDQYLKGSQEKLLLGLSSTYPEVTFERH
jgi:predicted dienelactone hydrolase